LAQLFPVLAALLAPALFAAQAQSGQKVEVKSDWPLFRGNRAQTGVAVGTLPDQLAVRWKYQASSSFEATVAIANGTVFAGCYDEFLYALDLATGDLKWKVKVGPVKGAPGYYKGAVYAGTEDGMLICLDAARGAKRWSFETEAEITGGPNFSDGRVVIGSYDATLYCFTTDGNLVWKVKTDGPVNGAPAIAAGHTFVAGCDSHLHVLGLDKGQSVAKVDLEGQAGATAAVRGDMLYVGTMTNQVKAIDWKQGKVLWSYEASSHPQAFYSSAAVTDKLVVVGSRDKKIHALERSTGKPAWTFKTGSRVDASPVIVGKRVYAPSLDGNLYVLDLDGGTLIQKLELGRGIAASPAVAGDCLVIGTTDGILYCLGAKK
jgi:outer membrane protein assembly factor BamB